MKDIFSIGNKKSINSITALFKAEDPKPAPEPKKEEWIWVEGYKGTDKDMKCRDFQYEIGGAYHIDDEKEVKACSGGFHLCLNLEDVFRYYEVNNGNRYFKVKALVRKQDYELYGKLQTTEYTLHGRTIYLPNPFSSNDKLAAREIIFLEEVETSVLYAAIREISGYFKEASDDIIKTAINQGVSYAVEVVKVNILVEDGYSLPFAKYIVGETSKYEKAHMLASQKDISMDVRVLTIMMD